MSLGVGGAPRAQYGGLCACAKGTRRTYVCLQQMDRHPTLLRSKAALTGCACRAGQAEQRAIAGQRCIRQPRFGMRSVPSEHVLHRPGLVLGLRARQAAATSDRSHTRNAMCLPIGRWVLLCLAPLPAHIRGSPSSFRSHDQPGASTTTPKSQHVPAVGEEEVVERLQD